MGFAETNKQSGTLYNRACPENRLEAALFFENVLPNRVGVGSGIPLSRPLSEYIARRLSRYTGEHGRERLEQQNAALGLPDALCFVEWGWHDRIAVDDLLGNPDETLARPRGYARAQHLIDLALVASVSAALHESYTRRGVRTTIDTLACDAAAYLMSAAGNTPQEIEARARSKELGFLLPELLTDLQARLTWQEQPATAENETKPPSAEPEVEALLLRKKR